MFEEDGPLGSLPVGEMEHYTLKGTTTELEKQEWDANSIPFHQLAADLAS